MGEGTIRLDDDNNRDHFANSLNEGYGRLNDSQHEQVTIDLSDEEEEIGRAMPVPNHSSGTQNPRGQRVPSEASDEMQSTNVNNN